jgi:hypothetical protein
MLLVDTKRPRWMALAPVALSNNSPVAEVHVSGATLESTFISLFLYTPPSCAIIHNVLTLFTSSEEKIGDSSAVYAVPLLDVVRIMKQKQVFLQRSIDWSNTLYGLSALRQSSCPPQSFG